MIFKCVKRSEPPEMAAPTTCVGTVQSRAWNLRRFRRTVLGTPGFHRPPSVSPRTDGPYPDRVLDRLPRGIYANPACLLYQPKPCTESTLAPLLGKDMRTQNLSWAGAAGAIISDPRDLARWIRALFGGRVIPQQQLDEMMTLVPQTTGLPIAVTSPSDPRGFGLDLGQVYIPDAGGAVWLYEGETLGYRAIFAYWPQYNLLMTTATNSQPPDGEDKLAPFVLTRVFQILSDAKMLQAIN